MWKDIKSKHSHTHTHTSPYFLRTNSGGGGWCRVRWSVGWAKNWFNKHINRKLCIAFGLIRVGHVYVCGVYESGWENNKSQNIVVGERERWKWERKSTNWWHAIKINCLSSIYRVDVCGFSSNTTHFYTTACIDFIAERESFMYCRLV
jgi:hypothetical protein